MLRDSLLFPFLLLAACSSSSTASTPAQGDGGTPGNDAASSDATVAETSVDGGCTDCMTTALTATFAGVSKPLTRAQFGYVVSDSGWPDKLHIEAHDGGSPACPTMSSPTTDRTLVMENVPEPTGTTPLTKADGITAAIFDFKGDLLTASTYATANTVKLTSVASSFSSRDAAFVVFDVEMTFPQGGTLTGRLYATHCASMD